MPVVLVYQVLIIRAHEIEFTADASLRRALQDVVLTGNRRMVLDCILVQYSIIMYYSWEDVGVLFGSQECP